MAPVGRTDMDKPISLRLRRGIIKSDKKILKEIYNSITKMSFFCLFFLSILLIFSVQFYSLFYFIFYNLLIFLFFLPINQQIIKHIDFIRYIFKVLLYTSLI